jgi:hypothetical protein
MTRLDEIRARLAVVQRDGWAYLHGGEAADDIAFLIAEVERLQARIDLLEPPKPHCKRPGCAWRNGRCSICEAP